MTIHGMKIAFPLAWIAATVHAAPIETYTIVHDPAAPPSVVESAQTLQTYIQRSTGHALSIAPAAVEPMIALGDTAWSRAAGVTADDLPWEAARLRTVGRNLFIVGRDLPGDGATPEGGTSLGTWHGVLTFLETVVGVRWLMPGEHGTHVPRHERLVIPEMDRLDAPGFRYRRIVAAPDGDGWLMHADPAAYEARILPLAWSRGRGAAADDRMTDGWVRNPFFIGRSFLATVTPTDPPPVVAEPAGILRLQYHQEVLLYAPEDGDIHVELEYEVPMRERTGEALLPAIPYYSVLDENLQVLHVGIARENRHIRFPAEQGRHYWLVLTETGMNRGMPYGFSATVPFALGDMISPEGMRVTRIETPLYFHVPADLDTFELVFNSGGPTAISVLTPSGSPAQSFEGHYRILTFDRAAADNVEDWEGFWKIIFDKPFQHGNIRQDRALSGFFSVDPAAVLIVRRKE